MHAPMLGFARYSTMRLLSSPPPLAAMTLYLLSSVLFSTTCVSASALEVVQIEVPPRTDYDAGQSCRQVIFRHTFANSDGIPYVGSYAPPEHCDFTTTIFKISITSSGRQYDRLGLLFFGDVELWRTSTAMPGGYDIYWDYQKDMTIFDALLKKEQKVIFSLDNVYSDVYTGAFDVTLEAIYYNDHYASRLDPADIIYPISLLASDRNASSVFSLPDDNGTVSVTFPRNTKRAVVSILASGNGNEEFWYQNVPSQYVNTFPDNEGWLFGYSAFREIELLIDGNLAGVSWPCPILFTGGVDPGFWRPIAGYDAYDLPTFEVDVTPWLPLLADGKLHEFALKVVGYDSEVQGHVGTVGENWYVTGSVFIWTDEAGHQTTGTPIESHIPPPSFNFIPELTTVVENSTVKNSTLFLHLEAQRTLSISSTIYTSAGREDVTWTQSLSFRNIQNMSADAYNQSLSQTTTGSFSDSLSREKTSYEWPINLYSAYVIAPTSTTLSSVFMLIDRSITNYGIAMLPFLTRISEGPAILETRQNGESMYYWNETIVEGTSADTSTTEQWFSYAGKPGLERYGVEQYSRHLKQVNDEIILDDAVWLATPVPKTEPLPYVEGEPRV